MIRAWLWGLLGVLLLRSVDELLSMSLRACGNNGLGDTSS